MTNEKNDIELQILLRDMQSLEERLTSLQQTYENSYFSDDSIELITEINLVIFYVEFLQVQIDYLL